MPPQLGQDSEVLPLSPSAIAQLSARDKKGERKWLVSCRDKKGGDEVEKDGEVEREFIILRESRF